MSADARAARSYYGQPILHPPNWEPADIAGYLFLGGLAGASSLLAAAASTADRRAAGPRTVHRRTAGTHTARTRTADRRAVGRGPAGAGALARTAKVGAAVAMGGSLAALIHDLGRPDRFLNMLRVLKPTSPMSVGSWLLSGYAPVAGAAAVSALTGRAPRLGAVATGTAAALGPGVVAYTAVLIGDTAVPAWQDAHRELPFVFAGSAATAAGGLGLLGARGLLGAPAAQVAPAARTAAFGAALELAAERVMHRRLGLVAESYERGRAGRLMRVSRGLTAAGALGGLLCGRGRGGLGRIGAALSGAALLAGSAAMRFGVFEAGIASARDPKYTVEPQRARIAAADGAQAQTTRTVSRRGSLASGSRMADDSTPARR